MGQSVAISAHKGGSDGAMPGHTTAVTYETYKGAIGSGAEYVEFDIRKTRDNVLVVYHDEHAGGSNWPRAGCQPPPPPRGGLTRNSHRVRAVGVNGVVQDREKTRPAMSTEVTLPDGSRLKYPRCPFRPPSVTM